MQQDNSPWGPAQPFLFNIFNRAQGLANQPALSPQTQQVQSLIFNRGLAGSPITDAAQNQVLGTLRGDFSNPFTTGAVKDVMDQARSQINSQFRGDNFGNSAHQEFLGRGLMSAAMPFAQSAFDSERQRQLGAAAMAPGLAGQDFTDLNQSLVASQLPQQAPWDQLFNFQRAIVGSAGGAGSSTSTQPLHTNPVAGALGGALGGHALGSALGFTGPWGALIGAGLGLLGS